MKKLRGKVISDKMQESIVVEVSYSRIIPIYKKRIKYARKFLADNKIGAKEGNEVIIQECRPISKRKRWRVIKVIK